MSNNSNIFNENIQNFIDKYGNKGFLQLFLENYLFELIQYFLHSEMKGDEDISRAYYINFKGDIYKFDEISVFEIELKKECKKRANIIIDQLENRNMLNNISIEILDQPEVKRLVIRQFENILQSFSGV